MAAGIGVGDAATGENHRRRTRDHTSKLIVALLTTCYHPRRARAYGYAPRERYFEQRGYEDRGGIGFSAPGVSVGIGTDRY